MTASGQNRYFVMLSHSFEEGPSGPARTYWSVKYGNPEGSYWTVSDSSLCTPFSKDGKDWEPTQVAYMLNNAVKRGRTEMQEEFKSLMAVKQ